MEIKNNFSLRKLNTFGITVTASKYCEVTSAEEVKKLINSGQLHGNKLILGGGSNLLFTKDFDGIVIKVNISGIHVVREDERFFWVKAGAGVVWQDLVESCLKANFGGIENLSLIPGTVGAAPIQNIGAYGVEIKDTFEALEAINLDDGKKRYFTNEECQFGYRDSIFKHELKDKYLITNVVLRLTKTPEINIDYGNVKEIMFKSGKKEFGIRDVSEAIINIRQQKLPDPKEVGNAGSFFKNPIISKELCKAIQRSYPDIPFYNQPDNSTKIPAAWLIDHCGLKGLIHQGAAVHTKQPLVLINHNNASGKDILELSEIVQEKVKKEFGILLESEVRII